MRDFIPDIHGDLERLTLTLSELGYADDGVSWRHPDGRIAVFLGDLIDKGSENASVISLVRDMVSAGQATCIMGNHELNALLFHSPGQSNSSVQDGWMRSRTSSTLRQHQAFLDEFTDPDDLKGALDFFLSMPLIHMGGGMRAVHACWSDPAVDILLEHCPNGRLRQEQLQEIALEKSDLAMAVKTLTKGPEIPLPKGVSYLDTYGSRRRKGRLNWWTPTARTYRDGVLSIPNPETLPNTELPDEARQVCYSPKAPTVVFGHYKMTGTPDLRGNAICLDYPDTACALREIDGDLDLVIPEAPVPVLN
ncbi:metallophosphoesterase [Epibacterium sp. DP7N7-1]|nr:metallophosphoesterase [Epibacterium sp. DP7N7-1]